MSEATQAAARALAAGRRDHAIAIINRAVQAGDVDAIALLALWCLSGSPVSRDLPQARRLLRQAAERGDITSAMIEIALAANGTGAVPNWATALALLRQQAAHSNGEAQAHLALLASMDLGADGSPRKLPVPAILSDKPLVKHWRGLLTKEECTHIATSVLDLLEPSMVADPRTGRQIAHPIRRSSAAVIGPTRETLPIQAIQRRIAAATGTLVSQGEPFAVLHYAAGQEYLAHMDTLPNEQNQRIVTVLIYLNEGYTGGETYFPATGLRVAGKPGDVIAFANVTPDGRPDPASRHAGLPVERGTKWLATRWIRQAPLDIWAPRA